MRTRIDKKLLKKLKSLLPPGSAHRIQTRLEAKGIHLSIQYIYRVLDPDKREYNIEVVEEAVEYFAEYKHSLAPRIETLTTRIKEFSAS